MSVTLYIVGSRLADLILDVFKPLFEVTKDPRSHPELHVFLQRVIGFDTVDDESKIEKRIHKKFPYPRLWDLPQSPPYSYWYVLIEFSWSKTYLDCYMLHG